MPPVETDPIEKRSYGKALFLLGTCFFAVSLWAFYDEVISRRSWKEYQRDFNALELKKVGDELQQAKQALDNEGLRKTRLEIEKVEIKMEGDEFKKAVKLMAGLKIKLSDAKQKFGFTKADQDESFYEWKHHLEEGHSEEAEKFKKKYYELDEKLKEYKAKVAEIQTQVDDVQKVMDGYYTELKKWQSEEKKALEPIAKLEKKIKGIHDRDDDIKQVVNDDLGKGGVIKWGVVDRCESCHVAINRDGFENEKNPFKTHPFRAEIFGKHPSEKFGCTTCHGGQGRATQIKGKPFGEGDFAHGTAHHWSDPLRRGDFAQSTCNKCHQDQWKLDYAPVYLTGKKLFWDRGCTGCHLVKGFENAPKAGPSLRRVGSKVSEEWLMQWIKNPRDYLPHAHMPKIPLDIDEPGQIEKVASYILQSSEPFSFPLGRYPGGNAEEGKKLFETVGCQGCHSLGEKGGPLAPALDNIARKTSADWIYNWIQNPKIYNPEARMPSLRLSTQEAANVTAFLMKQGQPLPPDSALRATLADPENTQKGFLLVSQYGCYGCHNIKGFENASKLSVELTTIAKKETFELDFGDTKVPRTWVDWISGKLKDPRMYLTEKTSSKMPNFGFTDDEIHALVIFLKGLKKEEVAEPYVMSKVRPRQQEIDDGRRFVERYNCKGCHLIEGEGRFIEQVVGSDKAPPILDGIGARVRPDWMFKFLKDPSSVKIRPWINVRMPTFQLSDQQANTVIEYFSAMHNVPSGFSTIPTEAPSPQMIEAGKKLASNSYFSCFVCHIQNGKTPTNSPEQWGPDLAMARQRIRHDFIPEWVKDPQKFTPGVKMPAFLPSDDAAPQDVLGGDRQKQAEALRDFVMSLSK
ncbi:MAG: c-type cytochrome [Deltaproteobacteria bacterium]|nr:c-type cytochrome [Deltaproteobacteria bacterium]